MGIAVRARVPRQVVVGFACDAMMYLGLCACRTMTLAYNDIKREEV